MKHSKILATGHIEYTKRAFQQDAQQAMGGEIERALVELITNADDSYTKLERADGYPVKGNILIEIERRRGDKNSKIILRDRAEGMSTEELKKNLTALGARTSGFEKGQAVRGLLGRGAKDVAAFGNVKWESIKDDMYSVLVLKSTGKYDLYRAVKAKVEIRKTLKIDKGNGTVVTVDVDKSHKMPIHKRLAEKLPCYFSLRDIMSDNSRKTLLSDVLSSNESPIHLKYSYPSGELKLKEASFTVPGYPEARATLNVYFHNERFDEEKRSSYRQGGVLIKSNRAIHEISMFNIENDPYSEYFFGKLECPYIDQLINEFDDRQEKEDQHPQNNNLRLITRIRDGLTKEHPFRKALWDSATELIKPLVNALKEQDKKKDSKIENEETKNRLSKLANAASKFLEKKMKELDEEIDIDTNLDGTLENSMDIIPSGCLIEVNCRKTFTVRANKNIFYRTPYIVQINYTGSGFEKSNLKTKLELNQHPKNENEVYGHIRIKANKVGGNGEIIVKYDKYLKSAKFEIIDEKPKEIPKQLCFDHKEYRIKYNKEKIIRILSPKNLVDSEGYVVRAYSDNKEIILRNQIVELTYDKNLGFALGYIKIVGRQLEAKGTIRANLGIQTCMARIEVVQDGKGIPFKFEYKAEDYGHQRAIWDNENKYLLKITPKHPTLKRYFGRADENFPGQTLQHCKVLVAEIIADKLAEKIHEIEEDKKGIEKN